MLRRREKDSSETEMEREKEKLVFTVSHVYRLASEKAEKEKEDEAKKVLTYSPDGHTTDRGRERVKGKRRIEKYLVSSSNRR